MDGDVEVEGNMSEASYRVSRNDAARMWWSPSLRVAILRYGAMHMFDRQVTGEIRDVEVMRIDAIKIHIGS